MQTLIFYDEDMRIQINKLSSLSEENLTSPFFVGNHVDVGHPTMNMALRIFNKPSSCQGYYTSLSSTSVST